ncbi:hypothetical protein D0A37_23250 [Microcoleus vaginatus HSN003]|nr:hypothetical protein D0A37_23250 [Microcoleus vaginatus HSN003]
MSRTGSPAHSTRDEFSCGTGILPVPKQVIENGAKYKFESTILPLLIRWKSTRFHRHSNRLSAAA